MIGVLMAITVGAGYLGAAVVARHRAQSAADLAALAAAGRLADGVEVACGRAVMVATAMRATVAGCDVHGLDVVVAVTVPVDLGRFGGGSAHAVARAGPVEADG